MLVTFLIVVFGKAKQGGEESSETFAMGKESKDAKGEPSKRSLLERATTSEESEFTKDIFRHSPVCRDSRLLKTFVSTPGGAR